MIKSAGRKGLSLSHQGGSPPIGEGPKKGQVLSIPSPSPRHPSSWIGQFSHEFEAPAAGRTGSEQREGSGRGKRERETEIGTNRCEIVHGETGEKKRNEGKGPRPAAVAASTNPEKGKRERGRETEKEVEEQERRKTDQNDYSLMRERVEVAPRPAGHHRRRNHTALAGKRRWREGVRGGQSKQMSGGRLVTTEEKRAPEPLLHIFVNLHRPLGLIRERLPLGGAHLLKNRGRGVLAPAG